MSDELKPCPVEEAIAYNAGDLLDRLCVRCPNRRAPTAEAELREALRFIASANLPTAKFARTAIETARAVLAKGGGV